MKFVEIFLQDKLFFDLLRSLKTFPSAAANYFVYVSIKKKKKGVAGWSLLIYWSQQQTTELLQSWKLGFSQVGH